LLLSKSHQLEEENKKLRKKAITHVLNELQILEIENLSNSIKGIENDRESLRNQLEKIKSNEETHLSQLEQLTIEKDQIQKLKDENNS
jgi:hypothetical protein